jgi:hypothetical protein
MPASEEEDLIRLARDVLDEAEVVCKELAEAMRASREARAASRLLRGESAPDVLPQVRPG